MTLFAKLAKFPSVVALQEALNGFVAGHHRDPNPFGWKVDPTAIIAATERGHQASDSIH